jgi:hypothetical protein
MITQVIYDVLSGDATLSAMLATYRGNPAVFTTSVAPGDAVLPYIVTAGSVADVPFDTKTTLGRTITRDVRCYAASSGSVVNVEAIAERVRALLHRQALVISGFAWLWSLCSGPMAMDEQDAYGRIVTVTMTAEEL